MVNVLFFSERDDNPVFFNTLEKLCDFEFTELEGKILKKQSFGRGYFDADIMHSQDDLDVLIEYLSLYTEKNRDKVFIEISEHENDLPDVFKIAGGIVTQVKYEIEVIFLTEL